MSPGVAEVAATVQRRWSGADAAHFVKALLQLWLYQRGQIPWYARTGEAHTERKTAALTGAVRRSGTKGGGGGRG